MRSFSRYATIAILLLVQVFPAGAAQFSRISDKKGVELPEVVTDLQRADIIFIGEIHYNKLHHKTQLDILRTLHAKKTSFAIGLEMFIPEDQQKLDEWIQGKLDEEGFLPVYARNWSYEWQLYRDLFIFARDNRIPMIALNTPKQVISQLMSKGPSSLKQSEVPPKTSWKLNESQADYMKIISHQVLGESPPEKYVARLSEAQALRNSGMAWNIASYRGKHPNDKIVVLAGTWHAVKNGVPELLPLYGKLTCKVILPELAEFNLDNATTKEADYLIMKQTESRVPGP